MTEIDYGRMEALEAALGGREAIEEAEQRGEALAGNRIITVDFAHDTPNLHLGLPVYTPKVGDTLLDAAIIVTEAWNGTTPLCDLGAFVGGNKYGWFDNINAPVDMTKVASDATGNDGLFMPLAGYTLATQVARQLIAAPAIDIVTPPGKFTAANPIKVVVSTTGLQGDPDPGSTQGRATVYFHVATPVRVG